jgi:ABC-type branched-subunit amino acid transport system substrate-binding protein
MKVRGNSRAVALLSAAALVLAACGDDDAESTTAPTEAPTPEPTAEAAATTAPEASPSESAPATDAPAGTDAPADTEAPADSEAPAAPSGDPVKVMVMGSFTGLYDTSFSFDVANAVAQAVNVEGGIQGRPMEILTCDDKFDPNATLDCARQASDEGAVAIISGLVLAGDYIDYAAQEGIPVIPAVGFQSAEFQNDISFPITAGGAGLATAAIAEVLGQGVTRISLVYDESSGVAKPAAEAAAAGLEAQGIEVTNVIPMAIDLPDGSSIVAAAEADDAQGVALLVQGVQAAQFISAADLAGSDLVIGSYDLSLEPATIKTLGPAVDGVLMASSFKQLTSTDDPAVQEFLAQLAAYDSSLTTEEWSIPGVGLGIYASTHLVAQAANAAASADAAGVLAAMSTITDFDIGITAPIDFSAPNTNFIPGFTRIFNTKYFINQIQDTVPVPLSDQPVDVAAAG